MDVPATLHIFLKCSIRCHTDRYIRYMARIDEMLRLVRESDATDLHLVAGSPPVVRRLGELEPTNHGPLTDEQVRNLLYEIIDDKSIRRFEEIGDLDISYGNDEIGRFRMNLYNCMTGMAAAIRTIPSKVMTLEELGMPEQVVELTTRNSGLVLVTGPTGSGKTTTLASMVNHINRNQSKHIITLEDPIEFVHPSQQSLVSQRQIGTHAKSFSSALRSALREDPDVVLVGEMRDTETIALALTAAEVGLLVFGTLHTNSASQTIDRILDVFPADQQSQARVMLSETLRGVISQHLLRRADGAGRVMVSEVLLRTQSVAALIRDGKTNQIPTVMQTSRKLGMRMLDDGLNELLEAGIILEEEALRVATEKSRILKRPVGSASGRIRVPAAPLPAKG